MKINLIDNVNISVFNFIFYVCKFLYMYFLILLK